MKVSELRKHLLKLKGSSQITFMDKGKKISIRGFAISENDDIMFFNSYYMPRPISPDMPVEVIYEQG